MDKEYLNDFSLSDEEILERIIQIVEKSESSQLSDLLSDYHDFDIARALPDLTKELRLKLFSSLNDEQLSDIFSYLENPADYIEEMSY